MPSLVLIKSPGNASAGQTFPLNSPVSVLGREESCEIVVPNHAVSRKHAQIVRKDRNVFVVEDLKSRNGTTVNNQPISEPKQLKHNDSIKICDFLYRFHDETVAERLPLSSIYTQSKPEPEEDGSASTIEHVFAARMADRLLESQPAERLRALLDISANLSRTLDLDKIIATIADKTLEVFRQADRCFVILQEGEALIPKIVRVRRTSGSDDDQRFSRTIVRRAISSGEAFLSEDASSDVNLGAAMSVAEFRIRSVMCVPLISPDSGPIGALQIDTQDRTKKFKQSDLELLAILANLAAVAVQQAKLHSVALSEENQRKEIIWAKEVQIGFLPKNAPPLPGYEFFHFYKAAKTVGGDYYDFIPFSDGRVAVVLGDVAGKGVPASLLMAKLSSEVRYCLLTQADPAQAIRLLNEQLINGGIGDRFVTLAAIIIDPVRHRAVVVNAGHEIPVIHSKGKFIDTISNDDSGLPLGIMSGYEYTSVECGFEPGDNVLVFTDGVTDAMNPAEEMFHMAGIERALAGMEKLSPRMVGEKVVKAVQAHAAGRDQNDDIAFICFGRLLDQIKEEALDKPKKGAKDTGSLYPTAKLGD